VRPLLLVVVLTVMVGFGWVKMYPHDVATWTCAIVATGGVALAWLLLLIERIGDE